MKTEPSVYSIDDLKRDKTCYWEGVRNYQARNYLREAIKSKDRVLFYHSGGKEPSVVGSAVVIREGYPDHTAWDRNSKYYDPLSTKEQPRWFMVDLAFETKFASPVTLRNIKAHSSLKEMLVRKQGIRLSVQPVDKIHFERVERMGNSK